MRRVLLFLAFVTTTYYSLTQLKGTITDFKTGKSLSGVEVFVNRSTIVFTSNRNGHFQSENIPVGYTDLVLYKKGYVRYWSSPVFRTFLKVRKNLRFHI